MKYPKDPGTVETHEIALPCRRGRPRTGNAKSAAQRVAESRRRKRETGDGERRIDLWISSRAFHALERLKIHLPGMTKRKILEHLIDEYQNQVMNGMSDAQFDAFNYRHQSQ